MQAIGKNCPLGRSPDIVGTVSISPLLAGRECGRPVLLIRRSAAQLKHPELRLRYLRAVQESEKALLQTVSALGFTPTARAKLGLVVAQATETQTRLGRFTGRQGRPPSA